MCSSRLRLVVALFATFLLSVFAFSRSADAKPPVQRGAKKIPLVKRDVSKPLRDLLPAPRPAGVKLIRENPKLLEKSVFRPDGALQTQATTPSAPVAGSVFEGVGEGQPGYNAIYVPPDTNGDVNGTYFVQSVNVDLGIFNKATGQLVTPPGIIPINTLWADFGTDCESNNDGDPIVTWDQINGRWIISQFSVSTTPYLQCVAISTTADPTGTYNRYAYSFGNLFPDYPKVGVWPTEDAYLITFNMFEQFFVESQVCAFQISTLIDTNASNDAPMQCFSSPNSSLLPADLDGLTQPAPETDAYIVARSGTGLLSWRLDVNWTNPASSTFTGPTNVSGVASYTNACNGGGNCILQPKPGARLDSLGARLMHRAAYRIVGGVASLVANHSVTATIGSGRKTTSTVGVRWYELRPSGTGLSVHQQGTYAPNADFRWMGSIAMDKAGNIGLGYSVSGKSLFPSIRYTGWQKGLNPLGQLQAEATLHTGSGSQGQYSRWGDYSSLLPDPDDCRFWYTTEYLQQNGSFNWRTKFASFKFPNCN